MFHPSEIELAETTKPILADVERLKPSCVVFDSLSELRLLAGNALRYRRQILALKQFFADRDCTVLLLDDMTATDHDLQVQSIAHGVILLEQLNPEYGAERRRLRVVKFRGVHFRGGYHDYMIRRGGLEVFPRLVAAEHRQVPSREQLASGIPALDTCSAVASSKARARSSSERPARASPRWPRSSPRGGRPRPARRDVHLRRDRRHSSPARTALRST